MIVFPNKMTRHWLLQPASATPLRMYASSTGNGSQLSRTIDRPPRFFNEIYQSMLDIVIFLLNLLLVI